MPVHEFKSDQFPDGSVNTTRILVVFNFGDDLKVVFTVRKRNLSTITLRT